METVESTPAPKEKDMKESKESKETVVDHISIKIEDTAVDVVIEIRDYVRENGLCITKPLNTNHLVKWLNKYL